MKNLIRLLLVSEPGKDGVFDYVHGLANRLWEIHPEIKIDLAYSSRRSGEELLEFITQIRAKGGEAVDLMVGNSPQRGDFQACGKIQDLVRRNKPQLIHAHSSKAGALTRILRAVSSDFPPVVYTPHAYFGLGGKRSPKALVFNFIEAVLGRVGETVCSSADERLFGRQSLHIPPRKLVVINNGVDTARFRPGSEEEKRACRAEFGLPKEGIILMTVGRDSPQKNYAPLYTALDSILADAGLSCTFVHAGAGAEQLGAGLSPAARKRFLGFNHVKAIDRLLRGADAFALTSRYEGLSLGLLQALSTGLKIFVTRVPGNRCLGATRFPEVDWIEPSEDASVLASRIERQLRAWLEHPVPPGVEQVAMARRFFNSRTQYEKIYRLYISRAVS